MVYLGTVNGGKVIHEPGARLVEGSTLRGAAEGAELERAGVSMAGRAVFIDTWALLAPVNSDDGLRSLAAAAYSQISRS